MDARFDITTNNVLEILCTIRNSGEVSRTYQLREQEQDLRILQIHQQL